MRVNLSQVPENPVGVPQGSLLDEMCQVRKLLEQQVAVSKEIREKIQDAISKGDAMLSMGDEMNQLGIQLKSVAGDLKEALRESP